MAGRILLAIRMLLGFVWSGGMVWGGLIAAGPALGQRMAATACIAGGQFVLMTMTLDALVPKTDGAIVGFMKLTAAISCVLSGAIAAAALLGLWPG